MRKGWKIGLGSAAGLVVLIQLVPVGRTNPPVTGELPAPDEVLAVLRESCYDCHSNETQWPWYAYVAPASWLVANHVQDGRRHLNLSEWNRYDAERRAEKTEEIWEEVDEGTMPIASYLWMHGDARLTDADRRILQSWSGASAPSESEEHEESGEERERG